MRVYKVVFNRQVKIDGKFVSETSGDDIEFVPDAGVIRIGRENVPMTSVAQFTEMERGYPCTVAGCSYAASDPRGLGAHLRHRHGIQGASPGRDGYVMKGNAQ